YLNFCHWRTLNVRVRYSILFTTIRRWPYVLLSGTKRACEREQHGDTNTDQERSVDKTSQQEHFSLQNVHQFWLTSGCFEVFTAHDTDTDTRADSAQADDESASKSNESCCGHDNSLWL